MLIQIPKLFNIYISKCWKDFTDTLTKDGNSWNRFASDMDAYYVISPICWDFESILHEKP